MCDCIPSSHNHAQAKPRPRVSTNKSSEPQIVPVKDVILTARQYREKLRRNRLKARKTDGL